ncbi:MAG: hypothetical protein LUQ38_02090 [Methanotrichaceae archaeon]|nr:hypothetical protein [Methanotrichaceae archaeon]
MVHDNAIAENLFPGYSTGPNCLSNRASTIPLNGISVQPSAKLFKRHNFPSLAFGYHQCLPDSLRPSKKRLFAALFAISDLAAMVMRVFPGDTGCMHALQSCIVCNLSALCHYELRTGEKALFAYISVAVFAFP